MDTLDRETLAVLSEPSGWPSISVYLPTHRLPFETDHDRIRLKNLAREATEKLVAQGMRDVEAEQFTAPLRTALSTDEFWHDTGEGMAMFLASDGLRVLKLEDEMPEQVVVGDRFYLRPLLAVHRTDQSFYALALDKNRARLFRGNHASIEEIPLPPGTPTTFEEAMKFDDASEPNLVQNVYTSRGARRGERGGTVFAGHGGSKDAATEQTARYARLIERGVTEVLTNQMAPLLLFGIDRQLSYYRHVNTYPHLVDMQVFGASDYLTPKQIHDKALDVLEPYFTGLFADDVKELTEREGTSLISHDATEIVSAAASGRVKTLFFDDSTGPFGTLDRETLEVNMVCDDSPRYLRERRDAQRPIDGECGWDLIDLAAAETALHGGEVHAFTGEDAPVHGVAAVFRY